MKTYILVIVLGTTNPPFDTIRHDIIRNDTIKYSNVQTRKDLKIIKQFYKRDALSISIDSIVNTNSK
jgi:hypothetical protein